MAILRFTITSPRAGSSVGRTVAVSGTARVQGGPHSGSTYLIEEIWISAGDGAAQRAVLDDDTWSGVVTIPLDVIGPAAQIRAVATGQVTSWPTPDPVRRLPGEDPDPGTDPEPEPDPEPESEPFELVDTVDVQIELSHPVVSVDHFDTPVTVERGGTYVLDLAGTASDVDMPIASVQTKVDDGAFTAAQLGPAGTGNAVTWTQSGISLAPGQHDLRVRAVNQGGGETIVVRPIEVEEPVGVVPLDQVFSPTRYLDELIDFARRYVQIDGQKSLTTAVLEERFGQPYAGLIDPDHFGAATAGVAQSRVAVEVLRRHLGSPAPAALDQRFRGLAYQTFLRALGTSYDELRLLGAAPQAERDQLAARLGLPTTPARPDRLDELTVVPESITDAQLAELCGYRTTAADGSLAIAVPAPRVLAWQRDAQRAQWQRDDAAERDAAAGPRPVIDPDLIPAEQVRDRRPTSSAFALWTDRRAWLEDQELAVADSLGDGPGALTRFDELVAERIGDLDLTGLAGQDADGVDLGPELAPLDLDLVAFRFLARAHSLLVDDVPLGSQWDDVGAICVQVTKRREFRSWRLEERAAGLLLDPTVFTVELPQGEHSQGGLSEADRPVSSRWRVSRADYLGWRRTLASRVSAAEVLETGFARIVQATENVALPQLRDALLEEFPTAPGESPTEVAERLSRELSIDLRADAAGRTTRVDQATTTLQATLFTARTGRLNASPGPVWTIDDEVVVNTAGEVVQDFDTEADWMGRFGPWLAATRILAYPENQLLPGVYADFGGLEPPTTEYAELLLALRGQNALTPEAARAIADDYLQARRIADPGLPADLALTDLHTDDDLKRHRQHSIDLLESTGGTPHPHQLELFWLVPTAIAAKLQESGHFQGALDWYQTVYAYHLPGDVRRIYHGLTQEDARVSSYDRLPEWLISQLNPHVFATDRRNCYTRATIMSIAGCFLAFADAEFTQDTPDGISRARTLYETAADLLGLEEARPETGDEVPFPANPLWASLREQAAAGLTKIHHGLNLAGMVSTTAVRVAGDVTLPSQYRYGVLVERAKNFVAIAQQVEAAYLSALEQVDNKTYDLLRARNDLDVSSATTGLHAIKVADAAIGISLASLQQERAQIQEDFYDKQIHDGLNTWEKRGLYMLGGASYLHGAAGVLYASGAVTDTLKAVVSLGILGNPASSAGQALTSFASALSTGAQIAQTKASFERRAQDWKLQRSLAQKDGEIGEQQVQLAVNQQLLTLQEQALATLQQEHAATVVTFLATRFTNAELFEWMSGVLARVYAYFLQQATALARLAESQLAFERQELPAGFVATDYWRDAMSGAAAPDRRGLTGSARLLQDVHRLDQYAFDTDRRKLHLTQTFPLSQLAAFELQQFRETGVLAFATPQGLFDQEFPGHYLRLVKRVKLSIIALIPPGRGVRATLSASGLSRVVVARGPFDTVGLHRQPESVAFTSPINATGMFELEPEGNLLLPFEGMGTDAVWQLEMPRPANPFDYRSIADVLITFEYTALSSPSYRERVVRELDRSFDGDRTFSLRNQFPDAWYDLSNPSTVNQDRRMRATMSLEPGSLPPHVTDLRVRHLTAFVLRKDSLVEELTFTEFSHTAGGRTVTAGEVTTTAGIASTRRPSGTPWGLLLGGDPLGEWEFALEDDPVVHSWLADELIDDIVLVMSLSGTTPEWP